ncbi:LexA family protein [Bosea eneae]|uniref:LexA family protein n=1 Tax=Bosea eneae TaxID=151454 RepID=A0ABW0IWD1_9HYPH
MDRQEVGRRKRDAVGPGIVEQPLVQPLRNQAACAALVDGLLPAIGRRVGSARDLADFPFAAEADDDCRRRFHSGAISIFRNSLSSAITHFVHGEPVLKNRKCGMNDELIRWIEQGLAKPDKSKKGLAAAMGRFPSAVTKLLKGDRDIKTHELPIIAAYLEEAPPAIPGLDFRLKQEVAEVREGRLLPVTTVGPVQAGAFIPIDEFDQSEPEIFYEPADPEFPRARRTAFDVIGDSMNRLEPSPILPGSKVIGVNYDDIGIPLRDKMVVVVQQERDAGHLREWSIKQIELQDEHIVFHPRSSNPRHKPIVVPRDLRADDGRQVKILALVREIKNRVPVF